MSDNKSKQQPTVETTVTGPDGESPSTVTSTDASPPESDPVPETAADQIDQEKKGFFAYFKTKEFYITLILG